MQWETACGFYGNARQPPELMHYGIKGQKWGLRRFQEENGAYTAEGKERYGRGKNKNTDSSRGRHSNGLMKGVNKRDWKPEDAENLSDEELNRRNSRLQREKQYKDSTTPAWKKELKQTSKDWAKEAAKKILIGTAVSLAVAAMRKNYEKVGPFISKVSKTAINKIGSSRNVVKDAASAYSRNKSGKSSNREYSFKPGSRKGFGSSKDFPTIGRDYKTNIWSPKKKKR